MYIYTGTLRHCYLILPIFTWHSSGKPFHLLPINQSTYKLKIPWNQPADTASALSSLLHIRNHLPADNADLSGLVDVSSIGNKNSNPRSVWVLGRANIAMVSKRTFCSSESIKSFVNQCILCVGLLNHTMPRYDYAQTFPRLISLSLSLFIWTCIPSLSIKVSPSLAWYPSCTHQAWWFQDNLVLGIRVAIPINSLNSQPCKQPGPQANQARLVLTHQCMFHLHHILKSNDFFKPLGVGQNRFPSRPKGEKKTKTAAAKAATRCLLSLRSAPAEGCLQWCTQSMESPPEAKVWMACGSCGLPLQPVGSLVTWFWERSYFPLKNFPPFALLQSNKNVQQVPPLKPPGPLQLLLVVAHRSQRHHNWEK